MIYGAGAESTTMLITYFLTPGPGGYALIIEREDDGLPLRPTGRSVVVETKYLNEVIEALTQKSVPSLEI